MEQTWNDLLFAHWPVPATVLRPLIPSGLPLDTFDGECWVAVTPFHMTGVRARWMPPIPGTAQFPELNVRTYVTYGGKPGVFFFSLDAASRLAVWGARTAYHLPYYFAQIKVTQEDGHFRYESVRNSGTLLRASYSPVGAVQLRKPGTIEHWLTDATASTRFSVVLFIARKFTTNHGRCRMRTLSFRPTRWRARQASCFPMSRLCFIFRKNWRCWCGR